MIKVRRLPFEGYAGTGTYTSHGGIKFGYGYHYFFYGRVFLPDALNNPKGYVLQQPGPLLHGICGYAVQLFVVYRFAQAITLCGIFNISFDSNIEGIFISDLLLFGVVAMVGKKFQTF